MELDVEVSSATCLDLMVERKGGEGERAGRRERGEQEGERERGGEQERQWRRGEYSM